MFTDIYFSKVEPIAQQEASAARQKANAAWREAEATRQKADIAWEVVAITQCAPTTQCEAAATWHNIAIAQHEAAIANHKAAISSHEAATALATTMDTAAANAEAAVPMKILYSLTMDCLRLSMQFFHPIQQCAQQVYHSTLPLSPTSSRLHESCLQNAIDNQLSHVTAFSGAPSTWGLLLRTIDVRPKHLTCIATFAQSIVAACEDIVNIYDAVTFVLRQSLQAPETVTKIQCSPNGSILFFAHPLSITMWDVQTGGLIHTFTTRSKINDIAASIKGDYIACGSSDGSVASWDIHTKKGKCFSGGGQPVVTISWLSPVKLAVATQSSIYIGDVTVVHTSNSLSDLGQVWGMVYLGNDKFLVGTSSSPPPGVGADQEVEIILYQRQNAGQKWEPPAQLGRLTHQKTCQGIQLRQLICPTPVGSDIACITSPSGVQLFNTDSHSWTNNPPLLDAAISVAVSLNRNLVVQTKDSIQIFSLDVLKTGKAHNDTYPSHIFPLGEKHIVCLQPNRCLALLELETLQALHPSDSTSPLGSLLMNQSLSTRASAARGLVAELGIPAVVRAWQSGVPLPEWAGANEEDVLLSGLSPNHTRVIRVYGSSRQELHVRDAKDGIVLANLSLSFGMGEVYDLTFDSETRFYLKLDGPGWHVQIPHDIIASPSGCYSHTVTRGDPVPLSEPRVTPPYSLDANCEWVLDAESRKICWISPGNIRRGNGGHFWAGLSLVMLGDDGTVRKLSLKEPER